MRRGKGQLVKRDAFDLCAGNQLRYKIPCSPVRQCGLQGLCDLRFNLIERQNSALDPAINADDVQPEPGFDHASDQAGGMLAKDRTLEFRHGVSTRNLPQAASDS